MFVFLFFRKSDVLIIVHPLNIYHYTTSYGPTLTGAKFYIHLRSLNVHFGMVEATVLKIIASRSPSIV
jgi:hypothetical protein